MRAQRGQPFRKCPLSAHILSAVMSYIHELRLALTVDDLDEALHFYHHALGLPIVGQWSSLEGRGFILAFGSTTIELIDHAQAAWIDQVEVGHRVSGPVRLAFEVQDLAEMRERLREAGVRTLADPVRTPWGHDNARLQAPDGLQITLYRVPKEEVPVQGGPY